MTYYPYNHEERGVSYNCTCGGCDNPVEAGNWCKSPPSTASDPEETEAGRMVRLCSRDILRGREEGRFEMETPRGHVSQDTFYDLTIHLKYPTEQQLRAGGTFETVVGQPLIGLEFGLDIDHEGVTADLSSFDTDVVVYGDQHLWRLTDPWESEVGHRGMSIGEKSVFEHEHEHWWSTVEEIDWRD